MLTGLNKKNNQKFITPFTRQGHALVVYTYHFLSYEL